jgi:hypothetical protein
VHDDAGAPRVLAVEEDGVAVDAADRQVVLVARDDEPARIPAAADEDRVAGIRARDRLGERRVLRDADRRRVRATTARRGERRERDDDRDAPRSYALASSSSFLVSEITF